MLLVQNCVECSKDKAVETETTDREQTWRQTDREQTWRQTEGTQNSDVVTKDSHDRGREIELRRKTGCGGRQTDRQK